MNSAIEQVPHHHEIKAFISENTEKLELAYYNALVRAQKEGRFILRNLSYCQSPDF